jgi:hypothetical protein
VGLVLAGRYLRPLVSGPLTRVDASQEMPDIASKCTATSGCGIKENQAKSASNEPLYDGLLLWISR